jgi:ectoine hydroxylase-related dioxygenase (phytanoyl-CoA dioxygenase family)
MSAIVAAPVSPQRITAADARIQDLVEVLEQQTHLSDYPHATTVRDQVLVYDAKALRGLDDDETVSLETEIARALRTGPGIVVFTGAFEVGVVDRTTTAFEAMIAIQRASGATSGDHFAKPGANDRVWNALEKLAVAAPDAFVEYYANDVVALAARSWLGPAYQVTSQVNVVNPGGAAQTVHRDYHLGFQSDERCGQFPPHVHELSQVLTLQGAVAHGDMPLVSGPTLYLPHSQKYSHGYVAYRRPEFQEFFESHYVQLPLAKGDAVFFNPALLHAAGSNHSVDIRRMANLLQISSAFGRAMETVDRERVVTAIYPSLLAAAESGMSAAAVENVVAAGAEGYPFPTNLDRAQPVDGMAPPSQAELLARAVADRAGAQDLADSLAAQARSQLSH